MYGTVARMRVRPGQEDGVMEYISYWTRQRKSETPGALSGYVYRLDDDPGTWIMVVAFKDRESYRANAESPQMDADYRRLRALLLEDPVWQDGEIVAEL